MSKTEMGMATSSDRVDGWRPAPAPEGGYRSPTAADLGSADEAIRNSITGSRKDGSANGWWVWGS